MVGPAEFLQGLFGDLRKGDAIELRRVPGNAIYIYDGDMSMPADLGRSTYHFGVVPRKVVDKSIVEGNLVWLDADGKPLDLATLYPEPIAVVASGSVTMKEDEEIRHRHVYWRLDRYTDVLTCVRLSMLAALAYGGDLAVAEARRVMRIPGSMNQKKEPHRPCECEFLETGPLYEVEDLEERLVAKLFQPAFSSYGSRHELALNIGALLARSGWDLKRALKMMNYLYDLSPGTDRRGKLDAVRTTYSRREAGESVQSRITKEVLGDDVYKTLLRALGITTRDEDLLIDGEVVGTKTHIQRDLANYIMATTDWASADGQLARWTGTHWKAVDAEVLRSTIFSTLAKMVMIAGGEETPYVAKANVSGAIFSIIMGRLLESPLPEANSHELPLVNGVLNIETGELVPHRREQWHRWIVPITFDPTAQCPTWVSFVNQSAPAEGLATFLQEWAGYCLISGNPWQRMLWLYGQSGTGKSTFIKILEQLLGPASTAISSETFSDYTVAQLAGKRLATASELSPRTMKTSTLKALIASDTLQARHPYGRPFDMSFKGKLVWSSNGMPALDQAEGMRRRINVVEFTQVPRIEDVYLDQRLNAELPGILNWALEGVVRLLSLRASGTTDWKLPPSVKAFVDEYMEAADPLRMFFNEEMELDILAEIPAIHVYQRYVNWAKDRQVYIERLGPTFYRAMRAFGMQPLEDGSNGKKRNSLIWVGADIKAGVYGREVRD